VCKPDNRDDCVRSLVNWFPWLPNFKVEYYEAAVLRELINLLIKNLLIVTYRLSCHELLKTVGLVDHISVALVSSFSLDCSISSATFSVVQVWLFYDQWSIRVTK
jgi:hypothetical protein